MELGTTTWFGEIWPKPRGVDAETQRIVNQVFSALLIGFAMCFTIGIYSLLGIFLNFSDSIPIYEKIFLAASMPVILGTFVYSWLLLCESKITAAVKIPLVTLFTIFSIGILISRDGFYDPTIYFTAFLLIIVATHFNEIAVIRMGRMITVLVVILFVAERSGLKVSPHPEPTYYHLFILVTGIYLTQFFLQHIV
ncbi:MAG: hypothetical protein AAF633_28455, partial [Chloroflexota bacterium]